MIAKKTSAIVINYNWVHTSQGRRYLCYMRPIFVEEACLACHGPKNKRPRFIIEKYPDDKAYDFKVGDLRGMIEIMVREE